MRCIFYTKIGMKFRSNGEVDRSIFNNPDVVKAEFSHSGNKVSFNLNENRRLIFFKEVTINSPPQTTYCVGYQKTLRGRNFKHILKFKPDGSIELEDS